PDGGADTDDMIVSILDAGAGAVLGGETRVWHKLTLTYTHNVALSESGNPNPFLDLRLNVSFFHPATGVTRSVPGFFACDGNAAETSATSGPKWRVNFTPDRAGTWSYVTSFRSGSGIALDPNPNAGQPASFDGTNGTFF